MQTHPRVLSIDSSQDHPTPHTATDDADRLTDITLISEDGWAGGKREHRYPRTRHDVQRPRHTHVVDGGDPTGPHGAVSRESFPRDHPPRGPTSGRTKRADDAASRAFSPARHLSESTTTHSPHPNPTTSQPAKHVLRNPTRTTRFRDPEPVPVEHLPRSDLQPDSPPHALDIFLDACIATTQALLGNGRGALGSRAVRGEMSVVDGRGVVERERYLRRGSRAAMTRDRSGVRAGRQLRMSDFCADEVVRVEGWWKVEGGEGWREVGGRGA